MTVPESPETGAPVGRTGVVLRDPLAWNDAMLVVETAEDTGYEAVFVPEIESREAFATLAGFARSTARVRLGTGVVTLRSRSPAVTAMAAATLAELSGGRFVLGVGAGSPGTGLPLPGSPLALTEEYVRVVRDLLAGRTVRSVMFSVDGFRLGLTVEPPPIWLAALGDRMVALAGRTADGVLLNWCPPERVASAKRVLQEATERAGRDPGDVTVAVYVRACLGAEDGPALEALRPMAGQYASIPHYLAQLRAVGLGSEGEAAARSFAAGRPDQVPEALVRALTVMGGRAEALARFRAYLDAGADLVLCYPVAAAADPFSSILGTVLAAAPSPAVER
ncbi:MAG TPA: LLM class flavin-dependent oxidoreductase [Actinomycetota bacterium]|nr:LLM class flavin-dependent oxidoreductase [Actinomycetota bacterium]